MEIDYNHKDEIKKPAKKPPKKGIVYLSNIPAYMTVTKLREIMSEYGSVGRIYLAPALSGKDKGAPAKTKVSRRFSEGWVEFERKWLAKQAVQLLNNCRIGRSKKSKFYDHIWNIKYLHSFKWVHLSERLAYERAVHSQRVRAEISRARKEATYFSLNVDKSRRRQRQPQHGQGAGGADGPARLPTYRQRETDGEIRARKHQPRAGDEESE
ncbi:activator of basal transcription 1-like [Bacillus rossius redtenbacheri]|uniref:activator of basal transcription 1-like n=1 Tax=Bacillus rossius redtenbacheri TaxID=93214 RepID=UPI002FDE1E78